MPVKFPGHTLSVLLFVCFVFFLVGGGEESCLYLSVYIKRQNC